MLQTVGVAGLASIAGCTGAQNDGGDETTDSSDPYGTDSPTDTATPAPSSLADSATVALATDLTAGVWGVYGGVMPYYTNIVEPLIWVTDEMELKPWLATDWEATGETTWEFTLREDVKFHNGDALTADAVVFSFQEILNEWSWAPGWLHVEKDGIKALDDRTVEFTTTDPFPTFPGTIAHNMVAIQHPDRNRDAKEVIGTGPFAVEEIKEQQHVKTSGFEEYWGGAPRMKELTFRVIADANTRSLSLDAHEVDVAYQPPRNKFDKLKKSEDTQVKVQGSPSAGYVGINMYKSPTDDVKLRQALNYAVPQATIVEAVLNNIGKPARGSIAPSIFWSAHDDLPEYGPDAEKAKQLVEESKYNGEELTLLVSTDLTDGKLLAQAVAQVLEEVGVEIQIQVMEDAAFDEAERNGEGHLALSEKGTNSGAADYIIYESFHSEGDVNERLYSEEGTGLYNPGAQVDELLTKGFQTGDPEKKKEYYGQVQKIVADEAAIIPLYYSEYLVAAYSDVASLDLRPIPEMVRWENLKHTK